MAADGGVIPFDFDGDGYADLAVGVPGEDLRGKRNAGAVQVLYGSASGPTTRDQVWHQGRKGVRGALENGDRFGKSLASGDFNADGYADLAVGIPEEDIGTKKNAGAVQVLYGGPTGLTAAGDQVWHQGAKGVPGSNERADWFGRALAVGDFDGDGYADLAVGVPFENAGGITDAGRVVLLRGSAVGLTSLGAQLWGEGSAGITSTPGSVKLRFGAVLAAGDVNGDGQDDLIAGVIDVPTGQDRGGAVRLLLGSGSGLTAAGSQYFRLADLGLSATDDVKSLWLGDVNADAYADLTVGGYDVAVLHGHADGFHPGPLAAPGQPGVDTIWGDNYRGPAVTGDVTGDGFPDLILSNDPDGDGDRLVLVRGTSTGLGSQATPWPIRSNALPLNVLPLSGGSQVWVVVGNASAKVGPTSFAGSVTVLRGTPSGAPGSTTVWHQNSPGIRGSAETGDGFGSTVGTDVWP